MFLHLSVILSTGGAFVVTLGGVHGCSGGACMVAWGGMCGCSQGGVHGCSRGACVVALGGALLLPGGHVWLLLGGMHGFCWGACVVFSGGACMVFSRGGVHRIRRDTVNERAVCILLECILVVGLTLKAECLTFHKYAQLK